MLKLKIDIIFTIIILILFLNQIKCQNIINNIYIKYSNSSGDDINNFTCNKTVPCSSFSKAGNIIRSLSNIGYSALNIQVIIESSNENIIIKDQDYIGEIDYYPSVSVYIVYNDLIQLSGVTIDGSNNNNFIILNEKSNFLDGNENLKSKLSITGFNFINFNSSSNNNRNSIINYKNYKGHIEFNSCYISNSIILNNGNNQDNTGNSITFSSCNINNLATPVYLFFDNYIIKSTTFDYNSYPIIFNGGRTLKISSSSFNNFNFTNNNNNNQSSIIIINNNYEVALSNINFINNKAITSAIDYNDNRNEIQNKLTITNTFLLNNNFNSQKSFIIKSNQPNNIVSISINNLTIISDSNNNNNNNIIDGILDLEYYYIINNLNLLYLNIESYKFKNIIKTTKSNIIIKYSNIPSSETTIIGSHNNIVVDNSTYNSILINSPDCNIINNQNHCITKSSNKLSKNNLIISIVLPISCVLIIIIIVIIVKKKMNSRLRKRNLKLQQEQTQNEQNDIELQPQQPQPQPATVNQIINNVYNEENNRYVEEVGEVQLVIPNFLDDSDSSAAVDDNIN